MPRYYLLILFVVLGIHPGIAQTFKEGFVRFKDGHELKGLIGKTDGKLPEAIQYKATDSAGIELYYANEVAGYNVDNIFYTAFFNPGANSLNWNFVELLVAGELTLIQRNNRYFILPRGSTQYVHLSDKFRSSLRSLMANCPLVASRAGKIEMYKTELSDYVTEYNECVAIKNPNLDGMPRPVSVALLGGFDYSGAVFESLENAGTRYLAASKLRDKSFIQLGVDVTFKTYKVSSLFGLYTGVLYNSNLYQAVSKLEINGATEVNEYSIDYTELKIPAGIEISRPTRRRLSYHVRGGVIFSKMLNLNATHPSYEVDPKSDGNVYYMKPANLVSFDRHILLAGTLGIDYRVFNASRIRLQGSIATGKVDATVSAETAENSIDGRFTSYSLMMGFVF